MAKISETVLGSLEPVLEHFRLRAKTLNVFSADKRGRSLSIKLYVSCSPEDFGRIADLMTAPLLFGSSGAIEIARASSPDTFVFKPDISAPLFTIAPLHGQVKENGLHAALRSSSSTEVLAQGITEGMANPVGPILQWALTGVTHAVWVDTLRNGIVWHRVLLADWSAMESVRKRMYSAVLQTEQASPLDSEMSRLFLNTSKLVLDNFGSRHPTIFKGIIPPTSRQAQSFMLVPYESTVFNTIATMLSVLDDAGLSPGSIGLIHATPQEHGDSCYLDLRFSELDLDTPVTHQAMALTALLASHARTSILKLAIPRADLELRREASSAGGSWSDQLPGRAACPLCGSEQPHRRSLLQHMGTCTALQCRFARCSRCRRPDHPTPLCPSLPSSMEVLEQLALSLTHELSDARHPAGD